MLFQISPLVDLQADSVFFCLISFIVEPHMSKLGKYR